MTAFDDSPLATNPTRTDGTARRAVLLTSYQTGATRGRNLGTPGYSYDLVAQLFVPLLARWGEVIPVARQTDALAAAEREVRQRGLDPVHISFVACQDMVFAPSAPNVVVPAWEFPDVPDHAFDGNPNNNWVGTADRCDLVIVGGQFTVEAFQRAGIRAPIRIVPVPTTDEYFAVPSWKSDVQYRIPCPAYVFPHPEVPASALWDAPELPANEAPSKGGSRRGWFRDKARSTYRDYIKPLVPPAAHQLLKVAMRRAGRDSWDRYVESCLRPHLDLSGVVYTSIFNPGDGRKNWEDLLTGFVWGLRDCDDATLLVKLVTKNRTWIERILTYYRHVGLAHRCKVVFVTDYLKHESMIDLVRASTYYVTTTRAEGNCLPVMNYLAAGRPSIAPSHSAIGDYFTEKMGFVVDAHPEPAIWPHDNRVRFRTTWGRLVWPTLLEQLRRSYHIARNDRPAYDVLSAGGRSKMAQWASVESVWPRLREALDFIDTLKARKPLAA